MGPRNLKRSHTEMEASEAPREVPLIEKIRNMWEFASVMQYIFIFGKAVKIDEDFDVEDFETELLKPDPSDKLEDIGLTLLKWISSHRGLNLEIWDEYARRQYLAKAPEKNPYGDDEQPKKFRNFDLFTKVRVLHQLTIWTFWNPDRMRERMPEHQREQDQLEWRIEELGYDREERQYYVLDDNRLYRRTEPPVPAAPPAAKAKPKANSLKAIAARRRESKRRRVLEDSETPEVMPKGEDETEDTSEILNSTKECIGDEPVDTFGGFKWELIAITKAQYEDFCESLGKREPNEKILRQRIIEEVMPIIEQAEEKQRRKIERRERELLTMEKMATAKRSSRLQDKHDKERQAVEVAEAERKRATDLAAARREQERQEKMERDRQSRMLTREQRIRDREFKRILEEEELAKLAEEAKRVEAGESRASERRLKEQLARKQKNLEELAAEEDWTFDCSGCGVHGKNWDDGSHSVACDKCSVWQHSKCLSISKAAAEKDDFVFVCDDCKRREEDAKKPKISLKFRAGVSSSPPQSRDGPVAPSPVKPNQKLESVVIPKQRPGDRSQYQPHLPNGYASPQANASGNHGTLPYYHGNGMQNGNTAFGQQPIARAPQYPYANSQPYPRPSSSSSPPPNMHANLQPALQQSGRAQPPAYSFQQYQGATHNSYGRPPSQGSHPPYYDGVPHTYQSYPQTQRSPSAQSSPRPTSSHSISNGRSPGPNARLPSPVLNRPSMHPTQGNYDTGIVTGMAQKSPTLNYHPALFAPSPQTQASTPQHQQRQQSNGNYTHHSPVPLSHTPQNLAHLSGLSPTKNSPPLPPPSDIPQKMSISPAPPGSTASRSVSGTPLFPPAEKLAPSPTQLSKEPVPTPSKQATVELGTGLLELKRLSERVERRMQGNGNGKV